MRERLQYIVVATLALVMFSVVAVMLIGLFDERVDNDKIFAIIRPAFQMIVGCFVGFLGGRIVGSDVGTPPAPPEPPVA
jgi:hypothetical protein